MLNLTYRPTDFKDFIGNEYIIKGLLTTYPDWPSTFLLIGLPGAGKTTLARLIAKQLDCNPMNLKEIDAGQDRGIDNIRRIINDSHKRPLVGKIKVYIFDECQGLTNDAQQALLKITEEAPKDTYFIFCSTNPQKIIKALQARCQQGFVHLQGLSNKELGTIISNICKQEKIELDDKTKKIASLCIYHADGIPRDAIMSFAKFYRYESVEEVEKELKRYIGEISEEMWAMVNELDRKNYIKFIQLFKKMDRGNYDSFRIMFANVFKKKLMTAIEKDNKMDIEKYVNILQIFKDPVDRNLGDIELIWRFGEYLY